jgi:PAS domain S-box-containing protein
VKEPRQHPVGKTSAEFLEILYRRHYQAAVVRSVASAIMWVFALAGYFAGIIRTNHFAGISASVLYLVLINPPTLLLLKRIGHVHIYRYASLLINFLEILGYTAIIYFLGGIEATYLTPIYAALVTYVGVVAPRSFPYIIALLCSSAFSFVVAGEYFGLLQSQRVVPSFDPPGLTRLAYLSVVIGLLFVVACISSLTAGVLKRNRGKLRMKNLELMGTAETLQAELAERRRMEDALRESEERFRVLFDNAPVGYHELDRQGYISRVNRTELEMLGYTPEEMMGRPVWEFIVERESEEAVKAKVRGDRGPGKAFERTYRRKDGTTVPVLIDELVIRDREGHIAGIRSTIQDITERKRAEEEREKLQAQFNQAQKMESVGRLAGGVAHDFNNMLAVVIGNTEMALLQTDPAAPIVNYLQGILKASQRSTDLVRQLLAFARKQTVQPRVVDLNDIIAEILKMLGRLIGENVRLDWLPGRELWAVKMDPGQIHQVLANLVVNSRDAITGSGVITLETRNALLDEGNGVAHPGAVPGEYVLLAVGDSGAGMSREVMAHIFEPFFSTKEMGRGTGLGLATVYGIVQQNNGFIEVESEEGKGTRFKIYLPRSETDKGAAQEEEKSEAPPGGTESVLMVEVEQAVLDAGKVMLESLGYTVLAAGTPQEAIRVADEHSGAMDLLLTDVVMPEMNCKELVEQVREIHPELKCLFMSGYTADIIARNGILDEGVNFLHKPFSMKELAAKVREAIDGT